MGNKEKINKIIKNIFIFATILILIGGYNYYEYHKFKKKIVDESIKNSVKNIQLPISKNEKIKVKTPKEIEILKKIVNEKKETPKIPFVYTGKDDPFAPLLPLNEDIQMENISENFVQKEEDFIQWLMFMSSITDNINKMAFKILYEDLTNNNWNDLIQMYINNGIEFKEESEEGIVFLDSPEIYTTFTENSNGYELDKFIADIIEGINTINVLDNVEVIRVFADSNNTPWVLFKIGNTQEFFTENDTLLNNYIIKKIDLSHSKVVIIDENNAEYTIYVSSTINYTNK